MHANDWADRGQTLSVEIDEAQAAAARYVGASRLGGMRARGAASFVWIVLRGHAWLESKEGRFPLAQGEWMILDRDSGPVMQVDEHGLAIGLLLRAGDLQSLEQVADDVLYPGRGRLPPGELRAALRLWRAARASGQPEGLRPILLHMARAQRAIAARVGRCPGRSRSRKRQVFGRMQRARLYLEGHSDRVVRIGELADLTSFSSWYFSKAFQALYDESPQALSVRLRLERASRLLRESSMTVGEVAAASGFENCCSFARAFRAHFGASATRYRAVATRFPVNHQAAAGEQRLTSAA
ncbi:helix-turn-helix transcriptional regulator [Luteimonas abyssi]|uniref:helix-turn-helix transcriptional regulator n=1 Tax=Luteimonas abyssi TaxID=1247514 RepID=UPI000737AFF4|nr:AraC family transcriptional regulator [Luteimonas abyssi]